MKNFTLLFAGLFLILLGVGAQDINSNLKFSRAMDSLELINYIDSIAEAEFLAGFSAVAVCGNQITWKHNYGYQNVEDVIPVDDSTIFTLYSLAKPVTSATLMHMADRNLIDIDNNINDYLPFNVTNPDFPLNIISARQLMSHVSSIRDLNIYNNITYGADSPIPLGTYLAGYLVPGGTYWDPSNYRESGPPGNTYEYCNIGLALAGYLVDTLAEGSFTEYCRDSILLPLEMNTAAYLISELDTNHWARWYSLSPTHQWIHDPYFGIPWYPAASLCATLPELTNFMIMMMNGGAFKNSQLLVESSVEEMCTQQFPEAGGEYGLGVSMKNLNGRDLLGHIGGANEMRWCEDKNTGVIFLCNMSSLGVVPRNQIMQALLDYAGLFTALPENNDAAYIDFQVYPNPVINSVNLSFNLEGSAEGTSISIYDLCGRDILTQELSGQSSGQYMVSIDMSGYPQGTYLIRLKSERNIGVKKVIKR